MSFHERQPRSPPLPVTKANAKYYERPGSDPKAMDSMNQYHNNQNVMYEGRPDSEPTLAQLKQYHNSTWSRDAHDGPAPMNNKMGNDQYCLRWNSYETNILSTFEGLLDSEALSDVTLFCEGESFKAHRLVLAACSTHFSKLFSNSPLNGQLIVILDGTRHQDLQILLQFMYRGVAYLHQNRIESVLRTAEVLQVKGLSDGGVEGVARNNGTGGGGSTRSWSPPPAPVEALKKEMEPPQQRSTSPRPSGRIAVPADSPLPPNQMPPPIFTSQGGYPRPPFPSIYQSFGFNRPEPSSAKPTSTSALTFPPANNSKTTDLASPGARDTSQYSKFELLRTTGEREPHEMYDSSTPSKEFETPKSPPRGDPVIDRDRSPSGSIRRPSSTEQFDIHSPPISRPKQIPSDSTTDKRDSPVLPGGRIYGEDKTDHHFKTEQSSSPGAESRRRSFSGDFTRDSLSRLSAQSTPSSRSERSEILAAQDLRTNDTEERIKRESNLEKFETLRRLQVATAGFTRESNMATIQKLEMFQHSREAFLNPGGFNVPLTAPLGIPASDLARIAISVPDPASNGDLTSGTGTKLKCPFCERTYGYETNLRAHIRQRHQGIRVPCPYCHRSFTRNNTVRRHIAREHRHQVNPKMIPTKFGQTKVMPDQVFQDHLNIQAQQQASQP